MAVCIWRIDQYAIGNGRFYVDEGKQFKVWATIKFTASMSQSRLSNHAYSKPLPYLHMTFCDYSHITKIGKKGPHGETWEPNVLH